jgi:hypothetical protein
VGSPVPLLMETLVAAIDYHVDDTAGHLEEELQQI